METLDRLFSEARNEAPETTLSEVQKWIVPMTLGALIIAFFAKMKLIITLKPFIMISSAIVAVGIGTGVVLTMNLSSEEKKSEQPVVKNTIHSQIKQDPKPNETVLAPVSAPSQKLAVEGEQQPVLKLLENWNEEVALLPSLSYCQSLPSNYILPYKPYEPVQPVKSNGMYGETIETGDFNAVKIWGAVDVVVMQGDKPSYRIENAEENENVSLHVTNKGKTLEIYTDCKNMGKNKCNFDFTVYLTVVDLNKINCSGASTVKSDGTLNLKELEIELSGASDIYLNMKTTNLKLSSSGASDIELEGSAENVKVVNTGASDLDADDFIIKKADINCSGASVTKLNVSEELVVVASGASEVYYKGSPSRVSESVTGASEIKSIK